MAIITAQMISTYYERFKNIEIVFGKDMIQTTGLIAQQVAIKCGGDSWPCVLCATSLMGAKIAVIPKFGLLQQLQKNKNTVSIRFAFKDKESGAPVMFFVAGKVVGQAKSSAESFLFIIQFIQRPPDFYIVTVGRVLDANVNFTKLKDERVLVTPDSQRRIKLYSKETATFIQAVPRRCLLRELAFANAKIIMAGVTRAIVNSETALRLDFDDPLESFLIKGKINAYETIQGKSELLVFSVEFHRDIIPTNYKIRLNEYFTTVHVSSRVVERI